MQSVMIAIPSALRLVQRGTSASLLYERLDFLLQLNEAGIVFQGFFETGGKSAGKTRLAEFLQALKIVDVTMVGRLLEKSFHTGDP
jgi:hypothetical protein